MINLIPPAAKKKIIIEYWLRVVSVWFYIWTVAILGSVAIMFPAYVLIHSQVSVYEQSAQTASEKVANFEEVKKQIEHSNELATKMQNQLVLPRMSDYLTLFRSLEGQGVTLSNIEMSRAEAAFSPIRVSGRAESRQALASFRDRISADARVEKVDLPLSNLAKDKDIQFSLTVTLKK
jgi:hypothetical protein